MHGLVAVDWHVIWQQVFHPDNVFFRTLWATVYISVVSQVLGVLLGLLAALARMSRFAPLRWISGVYVWIFRGTPLLVQIFYIYFAFAWPTLHFGFWIGPRCRDRRHRRAEHQRGRVHARDHPGRDRLGRQGPDGGGEVGRDDATGQAMRRIILPQAARVIVPPLGNEFNNMMKNTSLVYTIGVFEMFAYRRAELLAVLHRRLLPRHRRLVPHPHHRLDVHPGVDRAAARRERARRRAELPRAAANSRGTR